MKFNVGDKVVLKLDETLMTFTGKEASNKNTLRQFLVEIAKVPSEELHREYYVIVKTKERDGGRVYYYMDGISISFCEHDMTHYIDNRKFKLK